MNSSGEVAGFVYNGFTSQAFIGNASGSTPIPLAPGLTSAVGEDLNESNQVVGYGNNGVGGNHVFIGTTSGSALIPLPVGATTATVTLGSLNNSGDVVGYSDAGGWIWDPSDGTQLLNSFVPAGWNVSDGISIGNSGIILAQATFDGGNLTQYIELISNSRAGYLLFRRRRVAAARVHA